MPFIVLIIHYSFHMTSHLTYHSQKAVIPNKKILDDIPLTLTEVCLSLPGLFLTEDLGQWHLAHNWQISTPRPTVQATRTQPPHTGEWTERRGDLRSLGIIPVICLVHPDLQPVDWVWLLLMFMLGLIPSQAEWTVQECTMHIMMFRDVC